MIKQAFLLASSIFLFSCSEPQDKKVISYCMDTLNVYSVVNQEQCACFYNDISQKLSSSEIDKMITAPSKRENAVLTKEGMLFVTIAHASKCFE